MTIEKSALRFEGGPLDGKTMLSSNPWPHPAILTVLDVDPGTQAMFPGLAGGAYRKDPERESKLTDEQVAQMEVLARGVVYVWGPVCPKCLETGWHATGTLGELFGGGFTLVPCDCGAEMTFPIQGRGQAYAEYRRDVLDAFTPEGPEKPMPEATAVAEMIVCLSCGEKLATETSGCRCWGGAAADVKD